MSDFLARGLHSAFESSSSDQDMSSFLKGSEHDIL